MLRVIDQTPPTPCHTSLAQLYTPVLICNGAIQNTSNHFVFLYQQHALTLYFVSVVETHILVVFCILQNTEYIMCLGFSSDANNVRLTNVRILLLLLLLYKVTIPSGVSTVMCAFCEPYNNAHVSRAIKACLLTTQCEINDCCCCYYYYYHHHH